jgi:hypothetical protein
MGPFGIPVAKSSLHEPAIPGIRQLKGIRVVFRTLVTGPIAALCAHPTKCSHVFAIMDELTFTSATGRRGSRGKVALLEESPH